MATKHELFERLGQTLGQMRDRFLPEVEAALTGEVSANLAARAVPEACHGLLTLIAECRAFDDATRPSPDAPNGALVEYARDQYGRPDEAIFEALTAIGQATAGVLAAAKGATPVQAGTTDRLDLEARDLRPDGLPTGSTTTRRLAPAETAGLRAAVTGLRAAIPTWA